MSTTLPILVVEDDAALREAIADTLALNGYTALCASGGLEALTCLEQEQVGLVLSDVQMYPMNGHELLQRIKQRYPYLPVLLMTAYGMIEKAVNAMQAGASGYLVKPFEPDILIHEIEKYSLPAFLGRGEDKQEVIAQDGVSLHLLEMARRVAQTEATVLITGESGTGKEVFAQFIHRHSPRATHPFVAINCAAIPENLLEATLFGYEKGAFTGATQAYAGKFEQAQNGTLLLDEISEMPLQLQAKLLRVLQEREVERVGGKKMIPLDIRILATSNRDLPQFIQEGKFRSDLYYRLNVVPFEIPPLRERRDDILPLAKYLLHRTASEYKRNRLVFSSEAEKNLLNYPWLGNVRELENVIQRAVILSPNDEIKSEHLLLNKNEFSSIRPKLEQTLKALSREVITADQHKIQQVDALYASLLVEKEQINSAAEEAPHDLKSLEKKHILETLKAVNGSRTLAAQRLGMSGRTLRYKLQQYRKEFEESQVQKK